MRDEFGSRRSTWGDEGSGPDPDALAERVLALRTLAAGGRETASTEVYARVSARTRVALGSDGASRIQRGVDEGVAVRVVEARDGRVGFGAASGLGAESVARAAGQARRMELGRRGRRPPWSTGGGRRRDHDPDEPIPSIEDLSAWLRRHELPAGAWVESGRTWEVLSAGEGPAATRVRHRVWALVPEAVAGSGGIEERPRVTAARRLDDLPGPGLVLAVADRPAGALPPGLPRLLDPEPAAVVVRALVTTLCTPGRAGRARVGQGLKIVENPRDSRALAGGTFDDAGFATRSRVLADGEWARASGAGAGHYRRASFRDPPGPEPATPVVSESGEQEPADHGRVRHLRVHRLDPDRWILETAGWIVHDGRPVRHFAVAYETVDPRELALRCIAAVGPSRACANGVITPPLWIEAP